MAGNMPDDFEEETPQPEAPAPTSAAGQGSKRGCEEAAPAPPVPPPKKHRGSVSPIAGDDTPRCDISTCQEPIKKGKRWCEGHNRVYDQMYYQANVGNQLDMVKETMQGDNAEAAVLDFVRENPPDAKFRRKKHIC